MTEVLTTHDDRPKRRNGAKHNGAGRVLVSASALAQHLSCVRSYVGRLVEQGVLERLADGRFDQDQCRANYIAHLRAEHKRSPRAAADAEFTSAKTALLKLRILEKKKMLIVAEEAYAEMDRMVGMFLSGLSGFAARIGGRDLAVRRAVDEAVFDLRVEIADAASALADQRGEPPLDDSA